MPTPNAVRVLVVDNDPNVLAGYVMFFDTQGCETRGAGDGVDALRQYQAWHPDAVVLDVQMPGMDGRAVAKEIRRLKSEPLPILLAVTALSSSSEHAESIESGFDHHFSKPADLPAVLALISDHTR